MLKSAAGLLLSLLITVATAFAQPAATRTAGAAGHWEGKIEIPDHPMPMTVDLAKDANGAWIGTMTVVGTTSVDVPLSGVTVDDSTVRFAARLPEEASFEGHVTGGNFTGTATNPQGSAPMQLSRNGEAKVNLPPPSSPLAKPFAGDWQGTIETQAGQLHLVLKLAAAADGTAIATLVSVDQKNAQIPIQAVTIHDHALQLESRSLSSRYSGTLGANGEIVGAWSQGPKSVPLNFKRVEAAKP
jgi:hypothetical protein